MSPFFKGKDRGILICFYFIRKKIYRKTYEFMNRFFGHFFDLTLDLPCG